MNKTKGRADAPTIYEAINVIYKRINMLYSRREKMLKDIGDSTEEARENANIRKADMILLSAADLDNLDYMICNLKEVIFELTHIAQKAEGGADGQSE